MNENGDSETPSVVSFFSKRAKLVAKVTDEDFEATAELLNKIQKSRSKDSTKKNYASEPAKKLPRKTKKKKEAFPGLNKIEPDPMKDSDDDDDDTEEIKLSDAAIKRLKKIQLEKEQELQRLEAENAKILSAIKSSKSECDVIEEDLNESFDKITILTVSHLSKISRVRCNDNDKFSTIFAKVAESFNLKVSEFLLSFKEQIIRVEDTPKSLGLTGSDILECIPYIPDESSKPEADDANSLKIMFQTSDSKHKIEIVAHKLEKMQDIMEKYSKLRNIPEKLLAFEFDGEAVSGTETPDDLDMESGSCIDVRILTPGEETKKKIEREPVISVDSSSNDSVSLVD